MSTSERQKILDFSGKSKRQLQGWQVYSTLYYQDKLKDMIQASWKERYLQDNPDHDDDSSIPPVPLGFQNQKMRDLFDSETDEVKAEVEALQKARKDDDGDSDESEDNDGADEHKRIRELNEYQR